MSTLVMLLVAGMAMGSGPEKMSGEMEQGLDLRGKWKGTYHVEGAMMKVEYTADKLLAWFDNIPALTDPWKLTDEGGGKLRLDWGRSGSPHFGIYRCERDSVMICLGEAEGDRPTFFDTSNRQALIILHRVKSQK